MMNLLRRPPVWQTMLLTAILVTFWLAAPLFDLGDDDRASLAVAVAVLGTSLIVILWLRRHLLERSARDRLKKLDYEQARRAGPDALRDLTALQRDFDQAFSQLARAVPGRGIFRRDGTAALPWIMLLGPPGVGKSTALLHSGLHFTPLGRKLRGLGGTRNCDWWLAEEAIFLDTAGRYAVNEADHDEWLAFLDFVRQQRRRRPVDVAIIQISIDELLKMPEATRQETAVELRQRMDELIHQLGVQFPVYLIFNKYDRIEGFTEFFAGLSIGDQEQPFGFSLDVRTLEQENVEDAFLRRFDTLVAGLNGRATARMTQVLEADPAAERQSRVRALHFPREMGQHREVLGRFVDKIFYPSRHSERPWLVEVHFTSAAQGGETLPGARQSFLQKSGLAPVRPSPNQGPFSTPFFLNDLFQRIMAQAQSAAQPTERQYRRSWLFLGGATVAAAAACLLLTGVMSRRWQEDRQWLEEVQSKTTELMQFAGQRGSSERASSGALSNELTRQTALLDLLDRHPSSLLAQTHRVASERLRGRIDQSWLLPRKTELDRWLSDGTQWKEGDPPSIFANGFIALKTRHILDRQSCKGAREQDTRTWIRDQFLTLWQRGPAEEKVRRIFSSSGDTRQLGQLRRVLDFFFLKEDVDLRPADEVDPQHTRPSLTSLDFDPTQVDRARKRLLAPKGPEVVFLLIASNAGLLASRQQLNGGLLLDQGIEAAYTPEGCDRFFDSKNKEGQEWWSCVLDFSVPPAENLDEVYSLKYKKAWDKWLSGLSFKSDRDLAKVSNAVKLVGQVQKALDDLSRPGDAELDAVMRTTGLGVSQEQAPRVPRTGAVPPGKGPVQRFFGCAGKADRGADEVGRAVKAAFTPPQCIDARERYGVFLRALEEPKPAPKDLSPEEQKERQQAEALRTSYRVYLDALRALEKRLYQGQPSEQNRMQESLSLVLDTFSSKGELYGVRSPRETFLDTLGSSARKEGLGTGNLRPLLTGLDPHLWRGLLPLAIKQLNNLWTQDLLGDWESTRLKEGQDAGEDVFRCGKVVDFFKQRVEPFIETNLKPFASDLPRCKFRQLDPPLDAPALNLSSAACQQILRARDVISQTNCNGGGGGAAPPGGAPVPTSADTPPPPKECNYPIQDVSVDTGLALYTCNISHPGCSVSKDPSTGPSLGVRWRSSRNDGFETILHKSTFSEVLRQGRRAEDGRYWFEVPGPGNCRGINVVLSMSNVAGNAGPPSRVAWKTITLPRSLLP